MGKPKVHKINGYYTVICDTRQSYRPTPTSYWWKDVTCRACLAKRGRR